MARCPYLDYESGSYLHSAYDKYICKACRKEMDKDDSQVKYVCKAEYGEEYKNCPIYKDAR
ncbi:MAG: hypothetical protein J5531_01105 [Lachnospiraceae bacterium]|nr:hypothetical protein [Lachnospiraceae bacterium]